MEVEFVFFFFVQYVFLRGQVFQMYYFQESLPPKLGCIHIPTHIYCIQLILLVWELKTYGQSKKFLEIEFVSHEMNVEFYFHQIMGGSCLLTKDTDISNSVIGVKFTKFTRPLEAFIHII
jgi:hypothetical protein